MTSDHVVTGDGPTAQLAEALRALRDDRGFTQAKLAVKCQTTGRSISSALKGAHRPTWLLTRSILDACGASKDQERRCKALWDTADQALLAAKRVRPKGADPAGMVTALVRLMEPQTVTIEQVRQRAATARPPQIKGKPHWLPPRRETITAVLADRRQPPCRHLVMLALTACGCSYDDMQHWLERFPDDATPCDCGDDTARTTTPVRRGRARWSLAALGAAAITIGAGLFWTSVRDDEPEQRPGATASFADPPASEPPPARPGREPLGELAARTAQLPDDTGAGPVVYVHTSVRRRDAMSDAVEPFTDRHEQVWRRPDGSGQMRTSGADPARTRQPASVREFAPGAIPAAAGELSTDPGLAAERMHRLDPGIGSPAAALQTVANLHRYHCPRPAQRAALWRVLADTTGLLAVSEEPTRPTDRRLLQISAIEQDGTLEHRAVLDHSTGTLLSIETIRIPGSGDRLSGPTVTEATTFHSCRRLDSIG